MSNYTLDTFFNGSIKVKQNRSGYRFSIDAVILASHIQPEPGHKILDLGTGCGIIPLILAYQYPKTKIYGVEIQKELADIAFSNVEENQMANQITIVCKDIKELKRSEISGQIDWIVTNPPYRKANSGRINPDIQRAIARHEIKINLTELIQSAGKILSISGRFVIIYPAQRLADLISQMRYFNIEPKMVRMIHSYKNSEAKLVLVQGVYGANPGMKVPSPLIIYSKQGSYSDEVLEMFRK